MSPDDLPDTLRPAPLAVAADEILAKLDAVLAESRETKRAVMAVVDEVLAIRQELHRVTSAVAGHSPRTIIPPAPIDHVDA